MDCQLLKGPFAAVFNGCIVNHVSNSSKYKLQRDNAPSPGAPDEQGLLSSRGRSYSEDPIGLQQGRQPD